MSNGVLYVAYGANARREVLISLATLKHSNKGLESCVISDDIAVFKNDATHCVEFDSDPFGRIAKTNADRLSPFQNTLYLDADTRVHGDLTSMFDALSNGFDFVATVSNRQGESWLWHVPMIERLAISDSIGHVPVQFQGGVWGFRKTNRVRSFFSAWRKEWGKYDGTPDQGAMTRAIFAKPMKTILFGSAFNGGIVVQHMFGKAVRDDI